MGLAHKRINKINLQYSSGTTQSNPHFTGQMWSGQIEMYYPIFSPIKAIKTTYHFILTTLLFY